MEFAIISALNGVIYGLLLFMVSAGLTLIFGMMGVLNFAHASFYMLGAYVAYAISSHVRFLGRPAGRPACRRRSSAWWSSATCCAGSTPSATPMNCC